MNEISEKLELYVSEFEQWIKDTFPEENIRNYEIDDAGYPEWTKIENLFKEILQENIIKHLNIKDKKNILYLISRNWDIGSMINWMDEGTDKLSNLGNLSKDDFLDLAYMLKDLDEYAYDNAKFQFTARIRINLYKSEEIKELLETFLKSEDEGVGRTALYALSKLELL